MERKFLEEMGLDAATVDKVMAEHGKTIQPLNTQLSTAQETIKTANAEIARYKDLDIDGIQKAADAWKVKAENAEKDAAKQVEALRFDAALTTALTGARAKNPKAAKALLNMEGLKLTDSGIVGLTEQLEAVKKENAYLFESEPAGGPGFGNQKPAGTSTNTNEFMNSLIRGARGD